MTRILIVDDDNDFRASVGSFLRSHGMDVIEANNGDDGVRLAQSERPDLVVMDIMMTERTEGLFAVRRLRRTEGVEKTPVFVVSSLYTDVAGVSVSPEREWMAHDEFFPKPLDFDRFLEKVREYTAQRAGQQRSKHT